jgi:acetyl esterase/lipase
VIESSANELPFVIFYALVASTLLAISEHDISSLVGGIGAGVALLTAVGLVIVVRRAVEARAVLADALKNGLGAPNERAQLPLGQVLIAPVRIPTRGIKRKRDIAYGPIAGSHTLDVYCPRSKESSSPTMVYFHPGGFFSGGKSRESSLLAGRLVSRGWVYVSANYRLGTSGEFPNHLIDAKRVIAWLRAHAAELGADPHMMFLAGGSAGAHIAAMCALTANDPMFQPGFESADTSITAGIGLYGFYGPAPTSSLASAPADYLRADAAPFFAIHGDRDPMVSNEGARRFVDDLSRTSTSPVVYAELPGAQHNFDRFASIRCAAVVDAIETFTSRIRASL